VTKTKNPEGIGLFFMILKKKLLDNGKLSSNAIQ